VEPPPPNPLAPPLNLDEALARLKEPDVQRQLSAVNWLRTFPVNQGRKSEVAKALDPLLNEQQTRGPALETLKSWATADNVPTLLRLIDDPMTNAFSPVWGILGALQDQRSIDPLVKLLNDPARNTGAEQALRGIGTKAEKQVVKLIHSKNFFERGKAQGLLKAWNTPANVIFDQTVEDLGSTDTETRKQALDELRKQKPDATSQVKVAKALNPLISDPDFGVKQSAMNALQTWATSDNVPALVAALGDGQVKGRAYDLLGKLKDERAIPPLVTALTTADRRAAGDTLRKIGSPAEKNVMQLLAHPQRDVQREAIHLLGDIGTKGVSAPLLQKVAVGSPDRQIKQDALVAVQKIVARGR
jgi:HEAT repeat protein